MPRKTPRVFKGHVVTTWSAGVVSVRGGLESLRNWRQLDTGCPYSCNFEDYTWRQFSHCFFRAQCEETSLLHGCPVVWSHKMMPLTSWTKTSPPLVYFCQISEHSGDKSNIVLITFTSSCLSPESWDSTFILLKLYNPSTVKC